MTGRRLSSGGSRIDRSNRVPFRFDGRDLDAFEGDTLASGLLANGVVGGFRSPIIGRPRGIVSAGSEEPNAFVAVLEPWTDVIVPATLGAQSLLAVIMTAALCSAPALAAQKKKDAEKKKVETGASCKAPVVGTCAACSITCRPGETATCAPGIAVGDTCHNQPSCRCNK